MSPLRAGVLGSVRRTWLLVFLLASGVAAPAAAQDVPDAGVAEAPVDAAALERDAAAAPLDDAGLSEDAGVLDLDAAPSDAALPEPEPEPEADPGLEPGADRSTGIEGRIVDSRTGQPLEAAPVLIRGGGETRTVITDDTGSYRINLPPGRYTVRSYYDLFHGARIDGIRVQRGEIERVDLLLDPIDEEEEVPVVELEIAYRADTTTAAAQDQLRQASIGIGEGMGAEQMSQSGASDAESAARRVVGVTVDSSQLVIRGLGGRYTRVLLNGDPIPSTDPDRPGVDLDLFPTSVIDSINIGKVFLPEMPGDFAGGVLEINTVSYPRDFTLELGASVGANTQATLRDRLDYDGGRYDWLGFDDGRRSIPDSVPEDTELRVRRNSELDSEQIEAIAQDFRNVWQYQRTRALPKLSFDAVLGDAIDLPERQRFGYMVATGYEHDETRETGTTSRINVDGAEISRFRTEKGTEKAILTTLGTASLDLGIDHSLTLVSLLNRSMEDETAYQRGRPLALNGAQEKWQLSFVTRLLWFNQLLGDHRNLFDERIRLRWSGFYSLGERDEPDRRGILYGPIGDVQNVWDVKSESGSRFFSDLGQTDVGGRASVRFPLWPEGWGTLGGATRLSTREFQIRRFQMDKIAGATNDVTVYQAPPEELFSEEGIGTLTRLREASRDNDSYNAEQLLFAGFAQLESPIVGPLSAAAGARIEVFEQDLLARSPFDDPADVERTEKNSIDRTDTDILPGAALKYALTDKMFLRSAYSVTLGRAQIRELAPYDYYDFVRDRNISGNPELKQTKIHNADLRWEWFFDDAQVIAVSGFYKRFLDPIELQILTTDLRSRYVNAEAATSFGAEAELRVNLGHVTDALERFDFETNVALVDSKVEFPADMVSAARGERRMYGQAPYVVNAALHYQQPRLELRAGLVYNVVGPRITDVGTYAGDTYLPDTEEQPFHSLDVVASWGFAEHFKLKLKLKNILLQKKRLMMDDHLVLETDKGASASIGLSYAY